jgi:hypothetical protein
VSQWRRAAVAAALALAGAWGGAVCAASTPRCQLVLAEHRSERELTLIDLSGPTPGFEIEFEHSVLGTTVRDRYETRPSPIGWRHHLVEERFAGEGYGLPYQAAPGERLERDGDGWSLHLDRVVHPLVVRPLPAQHMRVRTGDRQLLLGALSGQAIEFTVRGCGATLPGPGARTSTSP